MDTREVACSGGQNGGGAPARVFPQHLRAAAGDPPDRHPHLAAPDGSAPGSGSIQPATSMKSTGTARWGLSWPTPRRERKYLSSVPRRALETILEALIGVQLEVKVPRAQRARCCVAFVGKLRNRPEQTGAASHRITQCAAQHARRPSSLSWGCLGRETGY
jgi:hypothetical protein